MTARLRVYPEVASDRTRTIVRDVAVVLLIAFFVWCGWRTHDLVDNLAVFGEGLESAGTSVQDGFGSAAGAVGNVPLVGEPISRALQDAGSGTGGNVADLGRTGQEAVHRVALLTGVLVALLPTLVLLVAVVPRRVRQVRELTAAHAVARVDLDDPERRRLLAMRAVFGLPYRDLLRYTSDPFGDLVAGRLDALVAAGLEDSGLTEAGSRRSPTLP